MKDFSSSNGAGAVPTVLVVDTNRWAFTARLAIRLSKAGASVSVVCPKNHPVLKTCAAKRAFRYSGLHPLRSLLRAIEATDPQIIVPCDDRSAQHLHELYEVAGGVRTSSTTIASLIEQSLGAPASYPIVSARYSLLEIAREEGLLVPNTSLIATLDDLKEWGIRETLPWVLKADGTWGGGGVKMVETLDEAEQSFLALTQRFRASRAIKRLFVNRDPFWLLPWWNGSVPAVIAQSHIHGRPANCAVACWNGKLLAGLAVEVVCAQGSTGPANVVRVVDSPEMVLFAERIARRLGLSGLFGLDFMIDEKNERLYLIEMNPRCTPLCHLQLGKGRDLIGALAAQLSGAPLPETPAVTDNDLISYFPQAWNCRSEFLCASFQDIPNDEPELVQELLQPWPDRSLLFRISNRLAHVKSTGATTVSKGSLNDKPRA